MFHNCFPYAFINAQCVLIRVGECMKLQLIFAIIFASLLVLGSANLAQAEPLKGWDPIKKTGYAVTSNYQGIDVLPGTAVVVTAGTTDLTVHNVTFIWHFPNGSVAFTDFVDVRTGHQLTTPDVPPNVPQGVINWANDPHYQNVNYLYAQSTHVINGPFGDWSVQAFFRDDVNIKGQGATAIRATSFNVIPEVPFGTLVIMLGMFGALSVFALKKKYITAAA
jgi:hypothetical protein